jgi:hypothetical protein
MKPFPRMLIAVSIIIVCVFSVSLVSALEQDEVSVSLSWSSQAIYQGGRVTVRITVQSNSTDELEIEYVGIHFDWMDSDAFYGRDLSITPVTIASYASHTFESISIEIPSEVSAGQHSYFVGIDGVQNYMVFSWSSPSSTINIVDASEKTFTDLVMQVQTKINAAINATYESAEAQSLLQQAKDAYTEAHHFANDGNYQEAISSLEAAADYADQAEVAEQLHAEQMAQLQQLLLYIAVIAVVVVIVVVIAVIWRKRRKMKPKVKQPPRKEELTISSVNFSGGNTIGVVVTNSGTTDFAIAEVWVNNEQQAFTITPETERIPPNESVHVSVTYAYSAGANYSIKIVSDRKKIYLVSATAL